MKDAVFVRLASPEATCRAIRRASSTGNGQGGPPAMVTFVRLNRKADRGGLWSAVLTHHWGSSTIARARDFYLVVNPDFSNLATPFTVTGLPRNYDDDDE